MRWRVVLCPAVFPHCFDPGFQSPREEADHAAQSLQDELRKLIEVASQSDTLGL